MRRRLMRVLPIITLVGAAAGIVSATPALAATVCVGRIGPVTVANDVVVPSGATCGLDKTTVQGNVTAQPGSTLNVSSATITGNLSFSGSTLIVGGCQFFTFSGVRSCTTPPFPVNHINGFLSISGASGGSARVCDGAVDGEISVSGNSEPVGIGGTDPSSGTPCAGSTTPDITAGNVSISNNTRFVRLDNNRINGSAVITGNTGGLQVTRNSIGGYLVCNGNNPPPVVSGNTAAAGTSGQC